jgi:hypothetical protein
MKIEVQFEPNDRLLGIFEMAKKLPQNLSASEILSGLVTNHLKSFMHIDEVIVEADRNNSVKATRKSRMILEKVKEWLHRLNKRGMTPIEIATETYNTSCGVLVTEQAIALGWKLDDHEDAFMFMMRRCREIAIEDAAKSTWNSFIRHLNESDPLLPKYEVIKGKRVMTESQPHKNFCGSIDYYRKKFFEANGISDAND